MGENWTEQVWCAEWWKWAPMLGDVRHASCTKRQEDVLNNTCTSKTYESITFNMEKFALGQSSYVFPNKQIAYTCFSISFARSLTLCNPFAIFRVQHTYFLFIHFMFSCGDVFFGCFCSVSFFEHGIWCRASYHLIRLSHIGSWHWISVPGSVWLCSPAPRHASESSAPFVWMQRRLCRLPFPHINFVVLR